MEQSEIEKSSPANSEECQLNRNRSFKSKQLVRSQAIRESQSPPRTASPLDNNEYKNVTDNQNDNEKPITDATTSDNSSRASDFSVSCSEKNDFNDVRKNQPVEIQITSNTWDTDPTTADQKQLSSQWVSNKQASRLLSRNPRVSCVCGACAKFAVTSPGRRRKNVCPTKQDSGIVCSDDCPDCTDDSNNTEDGVYCRCPDKVKDKPKAFSRTDSDDKSEPTGEALVNFIKETLNKNARDRMTLLKIEKELHSLVNDPGRCIVKFPVMTSYGRMLVHRVATLFELSHHLDQNKNSVFVTKSGTSGGRIPCTSFKQWCTASLSPFTRAQTENHAKSILKRDTNSLDCLAANAFSQARSKSLEQREKEYEKVRRRIFSTDNCNQEEGQWPWVGTGPVKLLTPDSGRNKLLKVQSLEGTVGQPQAQQWANRGAVSKSHSFGGYGGAVEAKRTLSRQGDLASSSWRLSPSSSGYRTLSLHSTDSVTPSPTGGASPEPLSLGHVVWCVTDLAAVPAGALLIHPQTGRPLTNADGSVYHYDPTNPPILCDNNFTPVDKAEQTNDKRRPKLEKQQSFIDNECECQTNESCCNKCSCDCRRYRNDKPQTQNQDQKPTPPTKRYEEPTNHNQVAQKPTNHKAEFNNQRPVFESTNQREPQLQPTNKRPGKDDVQYVQPYQQFRNDEITSPQVMPSYQPDLSQIHKMAAHTPIPIPDPNLRPVSLTNVMYPAPIPQPYPYVNRMEQPLQVYQPTVLPTHEEKHIATAQTTGDNTFRIDPSYPYAPLDYTSQCGACTNTCIEPGTLHQPHRSYSVPYAPEVQSLPPSYPLHNVILQHHHPAMHPYPYAEQVHWSAMPPLMNVHANGPKLYTHVQEMYPLVYHNVYPGVQGIYPQMVPQPYPVCQEQGTTLPEHRQKPNISGSSRPTPLQTPDDKKVTIQQVTHQQHDNIQQIKEQMAQLSTREKEQSYKKRDDFRRRNSGNGLLGNYPNNNYNNGRVPNRPINDESQLSSAARAIVNSIRSMQAKTNHYQDRREYQSRDRPELRRRDTERPAPRTPHNYGLRQMSPGTWCRRSPGPIHPILNPRRPPPDNRNPRR